jgi:hypothetical protein
MQIQPIKPSRKIRPFARSFLNPVFAKAAMALVQYRLNPLVGLDLGHSDQLRRANGATGLFLCGVDAGLNVLK